MFYQPWLPFNSIIFLSVWQMDFPKVGSTVVTDRPFDSTDSSTFLPSLIALWLHFSKCLSNRLVVSWVDCTTDGSVHPTWFVYISALPDCSLAIFFSKCLLNQLPMNLTDFKKKSDLSLLPPKLSQPDFWWVDPSHTLDSGWVYGQPLTSTALISAATIQWKTSYAKQCTVQLLILEFLASYQLLQAIVSILLEAALTRNWEVW